MECCENLHNNSIILIMNNHHLRLTHHKSKIYCSILLFLNTLNINAQNEMKQCIYHHTI